MPSSTDPQEFRRCFSSNAPPHRLSSTMLFTSSTTAFDSGPDSLRFHGTHWPQARHSLSRGGSSWPGLSCAMTMVTSSLKSMPDSSWPQGLEALRSTAQHISSHSSSEAWKVERSFSISTVSSASAVESLLPVSSHSTFHIMKSFSCVRIRRDTIQRKPSLSMQPSPQSTSPEMLSTTEAGIESSLMNMSGSSCRSRVPDMSASYFSNSCSSVCLCFSESLATDASWPMAMNSS
mmetsp:Transcript_89668/g.243209  ORF Transcript_89668/g.243209 Transcript_89668/m.243209 type:complete len:234 (-) Transcript_89668:141-842(-)